MSGVLIYIYIIYVHMYIYIYVCVCVCVCAHRFIMSIYVYIYIVYTYIYIYNTSSPIQHIWAHFWAVEYRKMGLFVDLCELTLVCLMLTALMLYTDCCHWNDRWDEHERWAEVCPTQWICDRLSNAHHWHHSSNILPRRCDFWRWGRALSDLWHHCFVILYLVHDSFADVLFRF